jgi:hypothetical protein
VGEENERHFLFPTQEMGAKPGKVIFRNSFLMEMIRRDHVIDK